MLPGLTAVSPDTARQSVPARTTALRVCAPGTRSAVSVAATTIHVAPSARESNASDTTPDRSSRKRVT